MARDAVLCASHIMSTRKFEQLSASSKTRTRFQVAMGGNVFSPSSPLGGVCTSIHCPGRGAWFTGARPVAQATHPAIARNAKNMQARSSIIVVSAAEPPQYEYEIVIPTLIPR